MAVARKTRSTSAGVTSEIFFDADDRQDMVIQQPQHMLHRRGLDRLALPPTALNVAALLRVEPDEVGDGQFLAARHALGGGIDATCGVGANLERRPPRLFGGDLRGGAEGHAFYRRAASAGGDAILDPPCLDA